jgi:hypothetical protein
MMTAIGGRAAGELTDEVLSAAAAAAADIGEAGATDASCAPPPHMWCMLTFPQMPCFSNAASHVCISMFTSLNEFFASPAAKKQATKDYHCACSLRAFSPSATSFQHFCLSAFSLQSSLNHAFMNRRCLQNLPIIFYAFTKLPHASLVFLLLP